MVWLLWPRDLTSFLSNFSKVFLMLRMCCMSTISNSLAEYDLAYCTNGMLLIGIL